jgi:CRISPR-associated endonuclease/helicase Cas3
MDADPRTSIGRWIGLSHHLADVHREAAELVRALDLSEDLREAVTTASLWHDLGKAHEQFQRRLVEPVRDDSDLAPPGDGPWAKSAHDRRPPKGVRPYFRHELASALAWLQVGPDSSHRDLVAYLIAAHHGKVRLSIRSVPDEQRPSEPGRLFARGVWDRDSLPGVQLPDGTTVGPLELDLSPMQLGEGSWLERMLALRDAPALGPFRLAFLEALVRIADWRASEKERSDA